MVDPVLEVPQESDRVEVLPHEVTGVEVQSESRPVADGLQRPLRGPVVVGDLAGVHLVREAHSFLIEHVQDRIPSVREVLVAALDHLGRDRREHGHCVPDRRSGEADNGGDSHLGGSSGGVLHLFCSTLPHTLSLTVAPQPLGQDPLVPLIDGVVADRLTDKMIRQSPRLQVVRGQDLLPLLDVPRFVDGSMNVEVVSPAGDFETVIAPLAGQFTHGREGEVSPLGGEQRDRTRHVDPPIDRLYVGSHGLSLGTALDSIEDSLHIQAVGE